MTRQTEQTALRVNTIRLRFQKENLQSAREFYEAEGAKLGRPNSKGWAACYGDICPAHRSKSRRSFSVNIIHGGWKCFGCDKHGDMVKFVMLRYGLSFKEACERLGCWDEDGAAPVAVPTELVSYLTLEYDIDGEHYCESVKDEPLDYAQKIRRFYREASDRLLELRRGDAERYTGEEENCWAQMVCAVDEWRGNL